MQENVEKVDVLSREKFIDGLINIVNNFAESNQGISFAIDGSWGCGKTYVLDKFEKKVSLIQSEEIASNKFLTLKYNCWEYDYYNEPLIAIVSSMHDQIRKQQSLISEIGDCVVRETVKQILDNAITIVGNITREFVKNKIGIDPVEVINSVKGIAKLTKRKIETDHKYDNYFDFKKVIKTARDNLKKLACEQPMILLVDELDRCLPTYAIKVLERLHHLFYGIPNLILIIAIDKGQLENTIKNIYGENVDTTKYLEKFINFTVPLDGGKANNNIFKQYEDYFTMFNLSEAGIQELALQIIDVLSEGVGVRSIEQIFEHLYTIHKSITIGTEQADPTILIFELLYSFIENICKFTDVDVVYKLSQINMVTDTDFEQSLGTEKYNQLKQLRKKYDDNSHRVNFTEPTIKAVKIPNNYISRVFCIMDAIKDNIDIKRKSHSQNYAFNYSDIKEILIKEYDIIIKFYQFAKMIIW